MVERDLYIGLEECADRLLLSFIAEREGHVTASIREGATAVMGHRDSELCGRAAILQLVRRRAQIEPSAIFLELTKLGEREVTAALRRRRRREEQEGPG